MLLLKLSFVIFHFFLQYRVHFDINLLGILGRYLFFLHIFVELFEQFFAKFNHVV